MSLGVIPIFWFEFLSDFWRKSQNEGKRKSGQNEPLCRREGHPRCGEDLRSSKGWPLRGETERPNGHQRVGYNVAVLRRSEALRRDEGTVHKGKIFWILF